MLLLPACARVWTAAAALGLVLLLPFPMRADATADLEEQARQLEKANRWQAAAETYLQLLRNQPHSLQWRLAIRRCQQQERLTRRYLDDTFRQKVLTLDSEKALELYGEVLAKIESNYVEEVKLGRLVAYGLERFEQALQNRTFTQANLPVGVKDETVTEFARTLKLRFGELDPDDRVEALQKARNVAASAQLHLGVKQTAVIVEFMVAACEALDEYSGYLTPGRFADVYALLQPDVVGIGIELRAVNGQIIVVGLVSGGPAARAGVQLGDKLAKIDELAVNPLTPEQITARLFGKSGTQVVLELLGLMDLAPRRVVVARQPFPMPSILDARIVDVENSIGYVQVAFFQKSTLEELDLALSRLNEQGMRALILDLRANPGGSFPAALQVADRFIGDGVLAATRGRAPGENAVHRARPDNNLTVPLVLLIDGDTASSAEIVAGAVRDHKRGVLIGQRSFGKGTMQRVFPLATVPSGIRLTTARVYSPLDIPYTEQGVTPDVEVPRSGSVAPMGMPDALADAQLRAAIETARQLLGKRPMP